MIRASLQQLVARSFNNRRKIRIENISHFCAFSGGDSPRCCAILNPDY
jgi:hypothetical protein